MKDEPLVEAARYADAQADEAGIAEVFASHKLDRDALNFVADQRALRLVVLAHRGPDALRALTSSNKPEPVSMNDAELSDFNKLKLGYLDGLAIGWIGRGIESRSDDD